MPDTTMENRMRIGSLAVVAVLLLGALLAPAAMAYDAIRLFTERAHLADPSFEVAADNVADVVSICRHLDGIPLAIELAAARLRSMSPGQIVQRLGKRFKLLTGADRTTTPRQETLLSTIEWSHDLLDSSERRTFAALSVFPGSFTMDAAEAVAAEVGRDTLEHDGAVEVTYIPFNDKGYIDPDDVRRRAREVGLDVTDVDDEGVVQLLLRPGFTTRSEATSSAMPGGRACDWSMCSIRPGSGRRRPRSSAVRSTTSPSASRLSPCSMDERRSSPSG